MKHITLPLFAFSLILLCSCTKDPVYVLNLHLSDTSFEMPKGATHQLSAEINPEDADNKSIDWTSSEPSVATVSNDGIVTALNVGNTIIRAMAADGSGTRALCSVEVYQSVESVCLDKAEYSVVVDCPATINVNVLPENAKYKKLEWSSDNETIAVVDSNGIVRGVSIGTCHIVASTSNGIKAECFLKVTDAFNGHAYVDLGLPSGTLWATMNVGASQPEDFGDYFAWGETKGYGQEDTSNAQNYNYNGSSSYLKTHYNWNTYKYCSDGNYRALSKYCVHRNYGTIDNKTELELSDDAARANWGGSWHIPSKAQVQELKDKCTQEWTKQNGVKGLLVTGPNGNQIFLPAAGQRWDDNLYTKNSNGYYWTSTLHPDIDYDAHSFYIYPGYLFGDFRSRGLSVRAVCP